MWPPPSEVGQEGAAAVDDAPEVHAQHPLPGADRAEPRVGPRRHAGVVAHDVHRAEALDGGGGQRLDLGLLAHVGPHREGLDAVGGDLLGGGGQGVVLHVGQDDVQAGGGEALGQGEPDAARRPGDDRDVSPLPVP